MHEVHPQGETPDASSQPARRVSAEGMHRVRRSRATDAEGEAAQLPFHQSTAATTGIHTFNWLSALKKRGEMTTPLVEVALTCQYDGWIVSTRPFANNC